MAKGFPVASTESDAKSDTTPRSRKAPTTPHDKEAEKDTQTPAYAKGGYVGAHASGKRDYCKCQG